MKNNPLNELTRLLQGQRVHPHQDQRFAHTEILKNPGTTV